MTWGDFDIFLNMPKYGRNISITMALCWSVGDDLEEGEAQVMMGRLVPLLQVGSPAVI